MLNCAKIMPWLKLKLSTFLRFNIFRANSIKWNEFLYLPLFRQLKCLRRNTRLKDDQPVSVIEWVVNWESNSFPLTELSWVPFTGVLKTLAKRNTNNTDASWAKQAIFIRCSMRTETYQKIEQTMYAKRLIGYHRSHLYQTLIILAFDILSLSTYLRRPLIRLISTSLGE